MKRSAFDELRDQRMVENAQRDRSLMCCAHGCPNRWSVDPPKACSAHAWAQSHDWPAITQQQLDADAQRALEAAAPKETQRFVTPDPARLRSYLTKLANRIRDEYRTPRMWIDRLRERELAGERLSIAQREMMHAALGRQFNDGIDQE